VRVESKCHAPHTAIGVESQFFHVRVSGPIERIHLRSAELRSESRQKAGVGQHLDLNRFTKLAEFADEFDCQADAPIHSNIPREIYVVKDISVDCRAASTVCRQSVAGRARQPRQKWP